MPALKTRSITNAKPGTRHKWTTADGQIALYLGDCLDKMAELPSSSIDTVICDPPYGLKFMGKSWDHGVPGVRFWVAALRVAKPGAMLMAFGGTRTSHRLACAIEDAGWVIRDTMMYVYGSGFPKSHDISKGIDKAAGAGRERIRGVRSGVVGTTFAQDEWSKKYKDSVLSNVPITAAAKHWQGYGTALKPAYEPITLAMKPLDGTFANNAQVHGVAGLWIDGGRVRTTDDFGRGGVREKTRGFVGIKSGDMIPAQPSSPLGRWPANLIHDGSDEVVGLFPDTNGRVGMTQHGSGTNDVFGKFVRSQQSTGHNGKADSGSAARFFYCAKASKSERNKGLDSTCTVKYDVPKIGGMSCRDVSTVLAESLKRATSESMAKWLIGESGESIMGLCQSGSLSTTLTSISKITQSQILNSLMRSLTRESIAGANCVTVTGGNHAENAASSKKSPPTTTSAKAESARGAKRVVLGMLSKISDGENWKPLYNSHATVKPLALLRYLCRITKTPTGGVVLDPFMGSGTTGVACVKTGRKFIGIEIEESYFEIAKQRIKAARREMRTA